MQSTFHICHVLYNVIFVLRRLWLAVATRGSVLYFVIVEISVVNVVYQTSLRQFLQVFDLSMARSAKSPVTSKRIQNIIECLTFSTFSYTARGLYEKDKFLFTILMTLKIQLQAKAIKPEEFQCFIKGIELVLYLVLDRQIKVKDAVIECHFGVFIITNKHS